MNKTNSIDEGREGRRKAILDILLREPVSTQQELVRALKRRGILATQVSISRDIADLGIVKAGGKYKVGSAETGAADPEMPVRLWVREAAPAGPNLVVARCDPGTAQRVAYVMDGMNIPGVVGTIGGDDTVFVAVDTKRTRDDLLKYFRARIRGV